MLTLRDDDELWVGVYCVSIRVPADKVLTLAPDPRRAEGTFVSIRVPADKVLTHGQRVPEVERPVSIRVPADKVLTRGRR